MSILISSANLRLLLPALLALLSCQVGAQEQQIIQPQLSDQSIDDEIVLSTEEEEAEIAPQPDPKALSWDIRIDQMLEARKAYKGDAETPDELFEELRQLLRIRARQFELILNDAESRAEPADAHVEILQDIFPSAPDNLLPLPDYVITVQDAHENFLGLYLQRNRLLEYVSNELRTEITSTDLVGMEQLFFEFNLIFLELRYQLLRLPDVWNQITQMAQRAPLPLVWFVLQLILFIALFRWWRRWFPETLNRMQSYLRAIRPRT
ncbi:MAG: hypothetical protein ACR2QG_02770, partial [Gammaproteobacteria bacterium]